MLQPRQSAPNVRIDVKRFIIGDRRIAVGGLVVSGDIARIYGIEVSSGKNPNP
jgi:hypothetical protein